MDSVISNNDFTLFDGAFGTMLEKYDLLGSEVPPTLNITHPEVVEEIHKAYLDAGSEVITTNTFEANALKLKETPFSVEEVVRAAIERARAAGAKTVALDIGPTGALLEPTGELRFKEAYEIFSEIVQAGREADLILLETFSDLNELRAAIFAAREESDLPIIASMSFSENGRSFTGTDPVSFAVTAEALGVDALGVNCSLGPVELYPIVEKIASSVKIPIIVQANAGLPELVEGKSVYTIDKDSYSRAVEKLIDLGVTLIGGCCGTTPEYISALKKLLAKKSPVKREVSERSLLTVPSGVYDLDQGITLVGERINPTGREHLKEALRTKNYDAIYREAIAQENEGADVLDVNLGLPEIDEIEALQEMAIRLPALVSLPLQLDSSKVEALEAALRVYPGIALVNSVNASETSLETILPLVKKYGAYVIGLTLDEEGIPKTAEERLELAKKIVERAEEYGIERERVIIDTLALTASADVAQAEVCLDTIERIVDELGVKTALGVSNISFGLPNRDLFNSVVLAFALRSGLNLAIINPASERIMDTVSVYRVFENRETNDYINRYSNITPSLKGEEKSEDLKSLIIEGIKKSTVERTRELLEKRSPQEIIEEEFIPALDTIGKRYESGEIFLPQLMQSAQSVKAAFEVIRENEEKEVDISRGKILIATVEGDIHDIGKNIVKMMLENYGYQVIDLGSDVKISRILDTVKDEEISLVGLSALMTTTVESMERTIREIRKLDRDVKVLVGGAVLTPEYAEMIDADYYAEDAQESVKIANEFFK